MGLQDVFFKLRLPFDGEQARALSARIAETIYYFALETSCELGGERGRHPAFDDTRAANGELQFDAWNVVPDNRERWDGLRERIQAHGLRNSLRSEEHTSELQSLMRISYAVFCLKKKKKEIK